MIYDVRNIQTNYTPVLVTNIPFLVLYTKNKVAAKIVRVHMPMLWVNTGGLPYKSEGDVRWKININIKPPREAKVGVAQA